MQIQIHYVIVPKPELVQRIRATGSDALSDLAEPIVWTSTEGKSFLSIGETVLLVKVLFLAALLRERRDDNGFQAAFSDMQVIPSDFDSRWNVTRLIASDVDQELGDALEAGDADVLKQGADGRIATLLDIAIEREQAKGNRQDKESRTSLNP